MVCVFKQQFLVFKQHYTYFHILFHPHVFSQVFSNNNFQFLIICTKQALNMLNSFSFTWNSSFEENNLKKKKEKRKKRSYFSIQLPVGTCVAIKQCLFALGSQAFTDLSRRGGSPGSSPFWLYTFVPHRLSNPPTHALYALGYSVVSNEFLHRLF